VAAGGAFPTTHRDGLKAQQVISAGMAALKGVADGVDVASI
jgi:hypothetical protein